MPTTTYSFVSTEISFRFKETGISQSINRGKAIALPRGILKGFVLGSSATPLFVQAKTHVNPLTSAAQESAAMLYVTASGVVSAATEVANDTALTIRTSNTINVDLNAYANQTVVIGLYGYYIANGATGPSTTAEIRVYTAAEYAGLSNTDRLTFVPMGTVVVPAAGVIPAANISPLNRMEAWENAAIGALPWVPILNNTMLRDSIAWAANTPAYPKYGLPGWEVAQTAGANCGWSPTSSLFDFDGTTPLTEFQFSSSDTVSPQTFSGVLGQRCRAALIPGQYVRIRLGYRIANPGGAGGGTISVVLSFRTTAGTTVTSSISVPTTTTAGILTQLDQSVQVPATALELIKIELTVASVVISTAFALSTYYSFSHFGAFVSNTTAVRPGTRERLIGMPVSASLTFDPRDTDPDVTAPTLSYDATTPASEGRLLVERLDRSTAISPAIHHKGRLLIGDSLLGANALKPRVRSKFDSTLIYPTLLLEEGNTDEGISATKGSARHYVGPNGELIVTTNAKSDNTYTWSKDLSGAAATKVMYDGPNNRVRYQSRAAGNNSAWADSAWDNELDVDPTSGLLIATSNSSFTLKGNRSAADAGNDIVLASQATRTNGKLISVQNNAVEKAYVDYAGYIGSPGVTAFATNSSVTIVGNRSAGDAGTDLVMNSIATRIAGKLVSVQNNTAEQMYVDFSGNLGIGGSVTVLPASTSAVLKGNAATNGVGTILDNAVSLTVGSPNGLVTSFRNNGSELASLDCNGQLFASALTTASVIGVYDGKGSIGAGFLASGLNQTLTLQGNIGGSSNAVIIQSSQVLSGTGTIVQFKNSGTLKLTLTLDGKIQYPTGSLVAGQATLVGGTKLVNTTKVSASSIVMLTHATIGGTPGFLSYTVVAGTSFTINSSSGTDTSVVNYWIIDAL
jgi:hypothetical protein